MSSNTHRGTSISTSCQRSLCHRAWRSYTPNIAASVVGPERRRGHGPDASARYMVGSRPWPTAAATGDGERVIMLGNDSTSAPLRTAWCGPRWGRSPNREGGGIAAV
jgi:hypothetical protein